MHRITPAHAGKTRRKYINRGIRWDHPRACGENCYNVFIVQPRKGSPPRMRGKHALRKLGESIIRITPAHAGKTILHSLGCVRCRDHPRACGENTMHICMTATG